MIGKILLVCTLVLSVAEGCPKKDTSPKSCDIRVNVHPHHVPTPSRKGRGMIEATVKAWCDTPPTQHTLIVRLETQDSDGKTWKQVGREQTDSTIPTSKGIIVKASTDCVDGIWRVYARAEGRGEDPKRPGMDKSFKFVLPDDEQLAREIKCPAVKLP